MARSCWKEESGESWWREGEKTKCSGHSLVRRKALFLSFPRIITPRPLSCNAIPQVKNTRRSPLLEVGWKLLHPSAVLYGERISVGWDQCKSPPRVAPIDSRTAMPYRSAQGLSAVSSTNATSSHIRTALSLKGRLLSKNLKFGMNPFIHWRISGIPVIIVGEERGNWWDVCTGHLLFGGIFSLIDCIFYEIR